MAALPETRAASGEGRRRWRPVSLRLPPGALAAKRGRKLVAAPNSVCQKRAGIPGMKSQTPNLVSVVAKCAFSPEAKLTTNNKRGHGC